MTMKAIPNLKKLIVSAGFFLALFPMMAMAAPTMPMKAAPKTTTAALRYKAACGMTYSAADARKYRYVCPMDKSRLVAVKAAHK